MTSTEEDNINSYTSTSRNHPYSAANEANQLDPIELLEMDQITAVPGTYTYTFQYNGIENKGYEGVLHIATDQNDLPDPTDASVSGFQHAIRIEVFGNLVYDGIFTDFQITETIHFAFFNFIMPIDNTVKITYVTDYNGADDNEGNQFMNYMQFGVVEHEKLLSPEGECVSSCEQIAGFSVGINYNTVPPTCIACDTSVFFTFSPSQGTCDCQDHYQYITSAGECQVCAPNLCDQCPDSLTVCEQCTENSVFTTPGGDCQC